MSVTPQNQGTGKTRRRVVLGCLIALLVIVAVPVSAVLYVKWVRWRGHLLIAKQPPGYWWASPYPLLWNKRVLLGMRVDPALQRQRDAVAAELNKALPQFQDSLIVVPLRVVNLGKVEYRHGLGYRLWIEVRPGARAYEIWHEAWPSGKVPVDLTPQNLARYVTDPRARRRLLARERPVPPFSTVDMLTVCQILDGKPFDLRQIRIVALDTDPLGFALKPNFKAALYNAAPARKASARKPARPARRR